MLHKCNFSSLKSICANTSPKNEARRRPVREEGATIILSWAVDRVLSIRRIFLPEISYVLRAYEAQWVRIPRLGDKRRNGA